MLFLKKVRRELRLRLRQTAVITAGLGIAAGAGLLTMAGPASAGAAGASHLGAHVSQDGPRCHIRVLARGGPVRMTRCCPPQLRRGPGRQITVSCCPPQLRRGPGRQTTVSCCPAPVRPLGKGRHVVLVCCPAQVPVPPGHRGPVRARAPLIPPLGRHCIVRIKPGGPGRHCLAPVPVPERCKISIGHAA